MLFWVLYLHLLGLGLCFFLWSLGRYLSTKRLVRPRLRRRKHEYFDPALVALEAQFQVAPRLALVEARRLLQERGYSLIGKPSGSDATANFAALMARLETTSARLDSGATALGRSHAGR